MPARSRANSVEPGDDRNVVLAETLSGVELCLEKDPFFVYGEEEPQILMAKEAGSKKRELPSLMVAIGN